MNKGQVVGLVKLSLNGGHAPFRGVASSRRMHVGTRLRTVRFFSHYGGFWSGLVLQLL